MTMISKRIRIGVICEGGTDYVAIKSFFGSALNRKGFEAVFIQIQPEPGRTDDAGWTRVILWLDQNPPISRVATYLSGGLFAGGLNAKQCDILLIQMDSDILGDSAFDGFMRNRGVTYRVPDVPAERGEEVRRLLSFFGNFGDLVEVDLKKHIVVPAVESTETWCVAAFSRVNFDPEELREQNLWDAFCECLLRSEGRPTNPPYGVPDKNIRRRESYCKRHAGSRFLEAQCRSFSDSIAEITKYM